jgi:hypothetical protein
MDLASRIRIPNYIECLHNPRLLEKCLKEIDEAKRSVETVLTSLNNEDRQLVDILNKIANVHSISKFFGVGTKDSKRAENRRKEIAIKREQCVKELERISQMDIHVQKLIVEMKWKTTTSSVGGPATLITANIDLVKDRVTSHHIVCGIQELVQSASQHLSGIPGAEMFRDMSFQVYTLTVDDTVNVKLSVVLLGRELWMEKFNASNYNELDSWLKIVKNRMMNQFLGMGFMSYAKQSGIVETVDTL